MGRVAFLFAGQGAQVPGMAGDVKDVPKVKKLFDLAEGIRPGVVDKMLSGTQEELNRTLLTQPTMFLADLAYAYAKEEELGAPECALGFSVGEVPALCFAGVLSEEDAFRAIVKRAELMEAYTQRVKGCMIAVVKLSPEKVEALCDGTSAHPANYNGALQTVVACRAEAEEAFCAKVKEAGGRAMKLRVSGMFHCPELSPEAEEFEKFLRGLQMNAPRMDVYANLTAKPYEGDFAATLARQMCSPVRFTESIAAMKARGIEEFVEVGPGKVLTGLVQRG
ncbi:MAG TPA: ACP S-malonyltransferase [Candidatus Borkfalkia avistercoris]|uniref:Malonyl CoA-acyl carrier protein transacylase n=1 Tax=Candidatus Borkfalkia avistercoris TaxID=2838504 RepID=A0A9D2CYH4_9FIRM|nr:ACP S-malonyltransferase [Candidatus Borkfalkia avistercoris]